jgi:hypothetical protein
MALKKSISGNSGYVRDAYIKFRSFYFEGKVVGAAQAVGELAVYETKQKSIMSPDSFARLIRVNFSYDLTSGVNLWTQAYDAAKQMEELQDAVDVLE